MLGDAVVVFVAILAIGLLGDAAGSADEVVFAALGFAFPAVEVAAEVVLVTKGGDFGVAEVGLGAFEPTFAGAEVGAVFEVKFEEVAFAAMGVVVLAVDGVEEVGLTVGEDNFAVYLGTAAEGEGEAGTEVFGVPATFAPELEVGDAMAGGFNLAV